MYITCDITDITDIICIQLVNKGQRRHCKKMKFSIKDFFSKCDQIRSFLRRK